MVPLWKISMAKLNYRFCSSGSKRLRLNAPRLKNKGQNFKRWRERMASMKQNQGEPALQDISSRMEFVEQNHGEPVSQDISLKMESAEQNHGEPVLQDFSFRMGSVEQNHEEPVSENISEDLHDNCIQEGEDYWRQEEAGPSNVKPPYMLKESKMLVNVAFLVKSLQSLNNHGGDGCNFSDMYITGETTIDCNIGIELSCTICLTTAFVWTDDPGPEFLERHPPKPFIPPPKKTPVIAEKVLPAPAKTTKVKNKVPTKPKRKKTPPPPRLPRVPRLKSIRQDFTDYYTSNSIEYQFPNDVTFIKQEVPEDEANSFLNQLPLLSTQPATVQLLFGVENADDVPQSSDKNVSLSPGTGSWNHLTSSVISLNAGHSVMTSASETIVPDVRPTEALPVDLNLVKAEVQEESQSMEVDNLPSVRILPMSVTSVSRSETAFASESSTKTSKDSTSVATTSVMASTYATESGVPLVSDILSAKGSSVSSCPTSTITQTMFQHVIPGSTEDFVRQTTNGSSNNNMVNLDGKIKS